MRRINQLAFITMFLTLALRAAPSSLAEHCYCNNIPQKEPRKEIGAWGANVTILPIAAASLHTDELLYTSGYRDCGESRLWSPKLGESIDNQPEAIKADLFCGGTSFLPNGSPFVAGGTVWGKLATEDGSPLTFAYNISKRKWEPQASMNAGRWYPTCVQLGSGNIFVASGWPKSNGSPEPQKNNVVKECELLHIEKDSSKWVQLTGDNNHALPLYPRLHLLPSGSLLYTGSGTDNAIDETMCFEPAIIKIDEKNNSMKWTALTQNPTTPDYCYAASVALNKLENGKRVTYIALLGGGGVKLASDAKAQVNVFKFANNSEVPQISQSELVARRRQHNAVILPTGQVLLVGGVLKDLYGYTEHNSTSPGSDCDAVLNSLGWVTMAELVNLETKKDKTLVSSKVMASAPTERGYHSVALLLSDGRVAVFGTGNPYPKKKDCDIFYPPYWFQKSIDRTRLISKFPAKINYSKTFQVITNAQIKKVVILRPGFCTHGMNTAQQYVELPFSQKANILTVSPPETPNVAPPGKYLLFTVTDKDVPSTGKWLTVGS